MPTPIVNSFSMQVGDKQVAMPPPGSFNVENSRFKMYRQGAFPQYNDVPDELLIEAHRQKYAPDMSFEEFDRTFSKMYADPEEPDTFLETFAKGLGLGTGTMISSTGALFDWLKPNIPSYRGDTENKLFPVNPMVDAGESMADANTPQSEYYGDLRERPELLLNPKWWAFNVGQLLPFTVSSLVPAAWGAKAAAATANAANMTSAMVKGGGLAGALWESLTEGGSAYREAIKAGMSEDEAYNAATSTFAANTVLNSIMQSVQVGRVLKDTKAVVTPQVLKRTVGQLLKDAGFEGATESVQEGLQNLVSQTALGRDPMEGLAESLILGGVAGVGFGGGLDILLNSGDRVKSNIAATIPPPTAGTTSTGETMLKQPARVPVTEGVGFTVLSTRGQTYMNTISDLQNSNPQMADVMYNEIYDTLTKGGKDTELVQYLNDAEQKAKATDTIPAFRKAVVGMYGDAIAEGIIRKELNDEVWKRMPKTVIQAYTKEVSSILKEQEAEAPKTAPTTAVPPQQTSVKEETKPPVQKEKSVAVPPFVFPETDPAVLADMELEKGKQAKQPITSQGIFPVKDIDGLTESGYGPDVNMFNTPGIAANTTYAWRTMGIKEWEKLASGQKEYRGDKAASRGNYLGSIPQTAAQFGAKNKVLVEFGAVKIGSNEGLARGSRADWNNVTKVYRYNDKTGKWEVAPDLLDMLQNNRKKAREVTQAVTTPAQEQPVQQGQPAKEAPVQPEAPVVAEEKPPTQEKPQQLTPFEQAKLYISSAESLPDKYSIEMWQALPPAAKLKAYQLMTGISDEVLDTYFNKLLKLTEKHTGVSVDKIMNSLVLSTGYDPGTVAATLYDYIGDSIAEHLLQIAPEARGGNLTSDIVKRLVSNPRLRGLQDLWFLLKENEKLLNPGASENEVVDELAQKVADDHNLQYANKDKSALYGMRDITKSIKSWHYPEGVITDEEFQALLLGQVKAGRLSFLYTGSINHLDNSLSVLHFSDKFVKKLESGKELSSGEAAEALSALIHETLGHFYANNLLTADDWYWIAKDFGISPSEAFSMYNLQGGRGFKEMLRESQKAPEGVKQLGNEYFARAVEQYFYEGKFSSSLSDGVKKVVKKIGDWVRDVVKWKAQSVLPTPNIEKMLDGWFDSEVNRSNMAELQKEATNNNPLVGSRIIGSVELDPTASNEEINDRNALLRMAGYQTRLTTDSKGAKHFIFYTTPGAKIESLINSYTKLLNGISITPEEHVRLGKAFGYTNNEIASYVGRLVSELGNVVSEKTDKANEKYYVGPAYKRTKDGRAIYYEAKKLPGDKYELTAINPKTTAKTKAEAPVIVNKQTLDHLFESVNLTVADRVRKGEYRGVTRKYEGEEEEQDTVFEDIVSGRAINDYTKLEVPSDIAKVLEEEEQKGVASTIFFAEESGLTLTSTIPASQQAVSDEVAQKHIQRQGELQDQLKVLGSQITELSSKRDKTKQDRITLAGMVHQYSVLTDELQSLQNIPKDNIRQATDEDVQKASESDPDQQSLGQPTRYTKAGIPTALRKVTRSNYYEDLGIDEKTGEKIPDDELERRVRAARAQQIEPSRLVMGATDFAESDSDMFVSAGEASVSRGFAVTNKSWIDKMLLSMNLNPDAYKYYLNKLLSWIGMGQVLARYNHDYFGKVFWDVDNGRKLSAAINNQLIAANKVLNEFWNQSKTSRENVAKILYEGTLASEAAPFTEAEPVKPWDKETWEKKADYLKTHTEQEWEAEKTRRAKLRGKWLNELSAWKFRQKGAQTARRGKVFTMKELTDGVSTRYGFVKLTPQEASYYFEFRRVADELTTFWKKAHLANGMSLEDATKSFNLIGYIPLDRGWGKWAFGYKDPTSATGRGWARFKTWTEADKYWKQMKAEGRIDVSDPRHQVVQVDDFMKVYGSHLSTEDVVELIGEMGIPPGQIYKHDELKKLVDIARQHTYRGKRSIRRGYSGLVVDPDMFKDVFEEWGMKTANMYASSLVRAKIKSHLGAMQSKTDDRLSMMWARFSQEYVDQAFHPGELNSELWDNVRRGGFLWALAGNVSNAMLNLTQPFTTTLPELNSKQWGMSPTEAISAFTRGGKEAMAYNMGSGVSDETKRLYPRIGDAIEQLKHEGVLSASYFEQLIGAYGKSQKVMAAMGILQSMTEKQNRLGSVLSAYIAAQDYVINKAKGNEKLANDLAEITGISTQEMETLALTVDVENRAQMIDHQIRKLADSIKNGNLTEDQKHQIATRYAARMSDTTQFIFGKHNLPYFIRSAGALANPLKSGFLFRGFILNYVGFLGNLVQSERMSVASMGFALMPLFLLAGISGFPFADDIKEALKSAGIVDTDTQIRKLFGDNQKLADLMIKGLPAALPDEIAFDFSRRAGAGQILPEGATEGELLTAIGDIIAGAPLSMTDTVRQGVKDLFAGDLDIAFRKILPNAAANIVKAIQYADEGVITQRGNMVVSPESLSGVNIGMQAMGVTPARVSKARDWETAIKYLQTERSDAVEMYNTRMAEAIRQKDNALVQEILTDIIKYNSKVAPGMRYSVKDQMRNIKRKVKYGMNASAEVERVPKALRQEAMRLEEMYK